MLSYSHMTIWANQSWLALGLDLDGLWSWKFGMVLVMNPLLGIGYSYGLLIPSPPYQSTPLWLKVMCLIGHRIWSQACQFGTCLFFRDKNCLKIQNTSSVLSFVEIFWNKVLREGILQSSMIWCLISVWAEPRVEAVYWTLMDSEYSWFSMELIGLLSFRDRINECLFKLPNLSWLVSSKVGK